MNEDAIVVIEEVAASLIDSANEIIGNSSFDEGRRVGYYEALSSIISQCEVMGVDLTKVGLKGFSPESILNKAKKAA